MMKMVKGGVLFYALAISIVIGLLMMSVIVGAGYHRMLLADDRSGEELIRNSESGVYYACATPADVPAHIDLFGRGKDSVSLKRKHWGAYDVCISTATRDNRSETRVAMLGALQAQDKYALWLADMDRPLGVCGNTQLKGTCYLPEAGTERVYIEGRSFQGRQIVEGETKTSSRFIPQYNDDRVMELQSVMQPGQWANAVLQDWSEVTNKTVRSFLDSSLVLYSAGAIVIGDDTLSGQITVLSGSVVRILQSAVLDNIIVIAPRVVIEDEVTGRFQVFARDSIVLGEKIKMLYPSFAGILPGSASLPHPGISVGCDSKIGGELFFAMADEDVNRQGGMLIDERAEIDGAVYCRGVLQLKGIVRGYVTAQKIRLVTNSASYDNCLLDAIIDRPALHKRWLSSYLTRNESVSDVVQWLQ